jgi:branched-chain amino acid transport system substrate-binding protein
MKSKMFHVAFALIACLAVPQVRAAQPSQAAPIRIGDINSYSGEPAFTVPYRNGANLAIREINAAGGVLGRPLELITRDDNGKPEEAINAANELVHNEKVVVLTGTFFSNVGLAISDFAKQNKIVFIAPEALSDALTWSQGNAYTFRVRSSTYMQAAMLAEQAAKLPAKRWVIVAPNYEFGHSVADTFKKLLSAKRPDVQFVAEQYPTLGKIDAGAIVQVLAAARPDAVFNATFGPDLIRFVREANDRGFFTGKSVVSVMTGQPEFLDPLKAEAPVGWIVTGYPWAEIRTPAHLAFVKAYETAYGDHPRSGSLSGYVTMHVLAAAIARAGSTDAPRLIAGLEGLSLDTPVGPITLRAIDHQSTMGMYVGRIALSNGSGTMSDWSYADGARYLPSDSYVRQIRPSN